MNERMMQRKGEGDKREARNREGEEGETWGSIFSLQLLESSGAARGNVPSPFCDTH